MKKISVIGMGSWGTTLAILLADKNYDVLGWEWQSVLASQMQKERENKEFLPGCKFPKNLTISNDLEEVAKYGEIVVLAVPSHVVRKICTKGKNVLQKKQIVNVAKGLEIETLMRMSEVIHSITGVSYDNIATLSGPTHAEEVSRKLPATIVAASINQDYVGMIQKVFMTNYFRVYTSTDLIGVEMGGSSKNIIAIAAGIADALKIGDNAKAALITRGIREIMRLGAKCGANPHTFSGISGIGDLIVTCNSEHSRNRYVGEQLGKGKKLDVITSGMNMVAEGIKTTKAIKRLSHKKNVEMPITNELYKVLFEEMPPRQALENLMTREARSEDEF
ncbi:MAG: NAD(P)-dependent glycerol-3-phosphate dehydrogenase [Candidatus Cloacimonetes bacterium]|nr:NAD(P)-dependent glycerol-3-phosphate dehydrogenase [Candidatus Cloacimonadota bacterium]